MLSRLEHLAGRFDAVEHDLERVTQALYLASPSGAVSRPISLWDDVSADVSAAAAEAEAEAASFYGPPAPLPASLLNASLVDEATLDHAVEDLILGDSPGGDAALRAARLRREAATAAAAAARAAAAPHVGPPTWHEGIDPMHRDAACELQSSLDYSYLSEMALRADRRAMSRVASPLDPALRSRMEFDALQAELRASNAEAYARRILATASLSPRAAAAAASAAHRAGLGGWEHDSSWREAAGTYGGRHYPPPAASASARPATAPAPLHVPSSSSDAGPSLRQPSPPHRRRTDAAQTFAAMHYGSPEGSGATGAPAAAAAAPRSPASASPVSPSRAAGSAGRRAPDLWDRLLQPVFDDGPSNAPAAAYEPTYEPAPPPEPYTHLRWTGDDALGRDWEDRPGRAGQPPPGWLPGVVPPPGQGGRFPPPEGWHACRHAGGPESWPPRDPRPAPSLRWPGRPGAPLAGPLSQDIIVAAAELRGMHRVMRHRLHPVPLAVEDYARGTTHVFCRACFGATGYYHARGGPCGAPAA